MMNKAVLLTVFAAVTFAALGPKSHQLEGYNFDKYVNDFGKVYGTAKERVLRRALFDERLAMIQAHNSNPQNTWRKGVNHLTDRTDKERAAMRGATILPRELRTSQPTNIYNKTNRPLPYSVDWRAANPPILSAVKDQGMCGSCWAHSATEGIETYWALAKGQLYVLSQQEITSCTPNPDECGGSGGCGGNIYENAFDYVTSAGGISQEWVYPYESYYGNTPSCQNGTTPVVQIKGYTSVPSNDAAAVLDALANVGPLSISVDASEWPDYEGGIFTGCDYAKNISMDHAVQLVGYGHDWTVGLDYWIVRNSWSPGWGENGFIRLHRFSLPAPCGWNVNNSQGAGCKGAPNTIWTCGICGIAFDAVFPNVL